MAFGVTAIELSAGGCPVYVRINESRQMSLCYLHDRYAQEREGTRQLDAAGAEVEFVGEKEATPQRRNAEVSRKRSTEVDTVHAAATLVQVLRKSKTFDMHSLACSWTLILRHGMGFLKPVWQSLLFNNEQYRPSSPDGHRTVTVTAFSSQRTGSLGCAFDTSRNEEQAW